MMGFFTSTASHIKGAKSEDKAPEDTEPDDTSILCVYRRRDGGLVTDNAEQ